MPITKNKQTGIDLLSVEDIMRDYRFVIPIYQRNFAWGEPEVNQLIQDIFDYVNRNQNYYIGSLVVYEREDEDGTLYETVDGQQRLTTLALIISALKNGFDEVGLDWVEELNLAFDSRDIANRTLRGVFKDRFTKKGEYDDNIRGIYESCKQLLSQRAKEYGIFIENFTNYLLSNVKLLLTPLPESTELNHYFEIMNNRGEQLEKHEILKSRLLDILYQGDELNKDLSAECFNEIWEACSNMNRYIQYTFSPGQRSSLFGSEGWDTLSASSFDEVCHILYAGNADGNPESSELSIEDIVNGNWMGGNKDEKVEEPSTFNSVIDFPNFLLHVLRIQTEKDISLDDKRLIDLFEYELHAFDSKKEQAAFVKEFIYNLFRLKYLFDKFVIKREFIEGIDQWSLKKLKKYDDNKANYVNTFEDSEQNRRILMLLSMFHVSTPTLVYKHWLNGVLYFLYRNIDVTADGYIEYLESQAKSFVFDRFLARKPKEYYEMIYRNHSQAQNTQDDLDLSRLRFDKIDNNLVFNYLDYLLWLQHKDSEQAVQEFEFSFRSSVEHYYPQQPVDNQPQLSDDVINLFGNLCLITHSKNSRYSNMPPTAKQSYYNQNQIDSIKQHLMMTKYKPESWDEVAIEEHDNEMKHIFLESLRT